MDDFFNPLMLSRWQFAVTTLFHMFWPLLTIGLGTMLVALEAAWLVTGREAYYRHVRFWTKPFLLSFGVGVASGVPLEFQFGTNWARFSAAGDGFFGNILGFEGAMAFMLEAAFLGIMVFGWKRVSRGVHLAATAIVALAASVSAFWIMDANAWMQVPAGTEMIGGKAHINDYAAAIFNPALLHSFTHMWVACLETSLFFVAGLSAWALLRRRNVEFFLRSFKYSLAAAVLVAPLQIYLGDLSGRKVAVHQPAKVAGIEAHWQTNPPGQGASWALAAWPDPARQRNAWELRVPNVLSILSTHSLTGRVRGLSDFPPADRPPIVLPFYCFRAMVGIGVYFLALAAWGAWQWRRGRLSVQQAPNQRRLLWAWVAAIPLGFIATDLGWIVREVGRQPWVIYNMLRTSDGVSNLSTGATATTFFAYCAVYLLLGGLFVHFTRRMLLKGPDLTSELPARGRAGER